MLHRQRVILELLKNADRPVSRMELTKWSFVLRHETESAGGSSFYDFLPYRFGPFSFTLYQELDKLAVQSYLEDCEGAPVRLSTAATGLKPLASRIVADIARVVRKLGKFSHHQLRNYVYSNYPDFTCNSEVKQLSARPIAKPEVFTAGYEGRSVDAFLNLLIQHGVTRLIDVRKNPIARRYGFHKSTLGRLCGKLDIDYQHVPALGIPSERRHALETRDDYDALFAEYESTTLRTESGSIDYVTHLVKERPSVLVCMEADPCWCHRSRLATEVSRRSSLPINHLGSGDAR